MLYMKESPSTRSSAPSRIIGSIRSPRVNWNPWNACKLDVCVFFLLSLLFSTSSPPPLYPLFPHPSLVLGDSDPLVVWWIPRILTHCFLPFSFFLRHAVSVWIKTQGFSINGLRRRFFLLGLDDWHPRDLHHVPSPIPPFPNPKRKQHSVPSFLLHDPAIFLIKHDQTGFFG